MGSKRIKAQPPEHVAAVGRNYRCPDCHGKAKPKLRGGAWQLNVLHTHPDCPVARRQVSSEPAGHDAAAAASRELGIPVRFSYEPRAPVLKVGIR